MPPTKITALPRPALLAVHSASYITSNVTEACAAICTSGKGGFRAHVPHICLVQPAKCDHGQPWWRRWGIHHAHGQGGESQGHTLLDLSAANAGLDMHALDCAELRHPVGGGVGPGNVPGPECLCILAPCRTMSGRTCASYSFHMSVYMLT